MALASGTRLGPYEVTAQIGVGGKGEVYRATDTKLDRDVAIKVLPVSLAGDRDRIARFQREAKTLAALNHPNIAQSTPSLARPARPCRVCSPDTLLRPRRTEVCCPVGQRSKSQF